MLKCVGTPDSIEPCPLKDRDTPGCEKLWCDGAGGERQASLGKLCAPRLSLRAYGNMELGLVCLCFNMILTAPSDALCGDHIKRSTSSEKCTLPLSQERELVTLNTQQLPAGEIHTWCKCTGN